MKIFFAFVSILFISTLSCLNPGRDNPYDPENPDKAKIFGFISNYDNTGARNANVALIQDSQIMYEVRTDDNGFFELKNIDPGLYGVEVKTPNYNPVIGITDLPAGSVDTFDIKLYEMFIDFEDEPVGVSEPLGFKVLSGDWGTSDDPPQGRVYTGHHDQTPEEEAVSILEALFHDFYTDVMFKVLNTSESWEVGMVLRYQNTDNFYYVRVGMDYIKLTKREDGSDSDLADDHSVTFNKGIWYQISADLDGSHIKIYVDNNPSPILVADDNTFTHGPMGLFVRTGEVPPASASARFDDIYVDTRN